MLITLFVDYSDTSFLVTFEDGLVSVTEVMVFDSVIMNSGEHYNTSSGIYTVPLDGTYQIVLHVFTDTTDQFGAAMIVDGEFVRPV